MRFLLALLLSLLPALALAAPLSFTIGTSEPVVVDTSGGTPLIWLDFGGGEARAATYRSGSGTAALEFAYDIAAGDFAPSGIIAAGQIELAGGAIRDLAGNPLTLSFTPPDLSGVRVRTYRPVWTTDPITAANASAAAFEITKAPLGASFAWEINSDGGGSASGSGTIATAPHPVAGIDLSALGDGTLTLSLTLTTAAGTGAPRTVTVAKDTLPWSPADLGPALALWFDADDASTLILNGSTISEWRDKSGNNRHASQNSAAEQPTYTLNGLNGMPVVTFDGGDRLALLNPFISSAGISSVVLFNPSSVTGGGAIWEGHHVVLSSKGGFVQDFAIGVRASQISIYAETGSNREVRAGTAGVNQTVIAYGQANATSVQASLNGGNISTAAGLGNTLQITGIGQDPVELYGPWFIGFVSEIVIVDGALSTPDRQRLEGYLAHKWGLAGSLPAGHPWKAAAP
ncbi:MAG: Cyanophage [Pseudomonadota bacterium]|jgi:hypothetical protein